MSNTEAAKAARQEVANNHTNGKDEAEELDNDVDVREDSENEKQGDAIGTKRERPEEESDEVDEHTKTEDEEQSSGDEQDASHPRKKARTDDGEQRQTGKRTVQKNEGDDSKSASKGDEKHGKPGSVDRLPEEGQRVHWRAASGWCEGTK